MTKLSQIIYERGKVWVREDKKNEMYVVFVNGITHATSDSAYATKCLAIARASYLSKRYEERETDKTGE